jgi:hypothetical protein
MHTADRIHCDRLGLNSPINTLLPDILRLILRREQNANPDTINQVLFEWREQSVRLIIRLRRGEYRLKSSLKCVGLRVLFDPDCNNV